MNIGRINPVNFSGIRVANNGDGDDNTNNSRAAQNAILRSWEEQEALLDKQKAMIAEDMEVLEMLKYLNMETTGNVNIDYAQVVENQNIIDKAGKITDKLENIVKEKCIVALTHQRRLYEENQKAIKRQEISNKDEVTLLRKKENFGISKVIGYDRELGVLEREFINKVKKEKEGDNPNVFGSILFFGPSGNGKTYVTKAIAEETGCRVVNIHPKMNRKLAEKNFQKLKEEAKKSEEHFKKDRTRTILLIDEADQMINEDASYKKEFEEFIKTCSTKYHCTVFATSNNPLGIAVNYNDPEIFPIRMSIDIPDRKTVSKMFQFNMKNYPTEDMDYDRLGNEIIQKGKALNGAYSNGEIRSICDRIWKTKDEGATTNEDVVEYINNKLGKPTLDKQAKEEFNRQYNEIMNGKRG